MGNPSPRHTTEFKQRAVGPCRKLRPPSAHAMRDEEFAVAISRVRDEA